MEKTHEIILNNKATYEAIGEHNSNHCKPVFNDEGKRFSSVIDAAKYAGVTPGTMCGHLRGKCRTCNGHVYFYVNKRDESFDLIMSRLSEVSAEMERRKADEDDARKWREYQAEQEAIRKAEEKRIADERKAKEMYEANVQKAINKIQRRHKMLERAKQQVNDINNRIMEAEKEYEALTGKPYVEESCEREEEVA